MNELSNRLKAIALEINHGETMADIGTDHGFLPLFLWQMGICPKVILTDVSQGSLEKAMENCEKQQPGKLFDCRLGDGLQVLGAGEVDAVVIAGMGGILIAEIMGEDMAKTKSFGKFILQPRSAVGELRHWLFHNGFSVTGESLVREGKFICEILTVEPKPEKVVELALAGEKRNSIRWEVPRHYGDWDDDLTKEYLERKLKREEMILTAMKNSEKTDKSRTRRNIVYLQGLLEKK